MDPHAKAMIEQTQSVETERLLVACRMKECEHRIHLQKQSQEKLSQLLKAKEQEERDTAATLEVLTAEQDQLKQQLLTQADSLRKCEVEEALLLKGAQERLQTEKDELHACEAKMADLNALRNTFKPTDMILQMKHDVDTLHHQRQALTAEQEVLANDIQLTQRAIEVANHPLGSHDERTPYGEPARAVARSSSDSALFTTRSAISFADPDENTEAEEVQLLRAQIAQKQRELDQLTSLSTHRTSAVAREVTDLTRRRAELCQWRDQARDSLQQLQLRQDTLSTAISELLCFHCAQNTSSSQGA